ncbi:Spermidine/putrescine import ATP-binding protein PotA [Pseudovibrio axinellae]|uniref:Spermidine/putrescine import ATP-binding protein PotA n=1 Tax=Pseudovibrio axinellae TaxID=989403 RepID=A0A165SWS9_9HYPH|nr:ABC transporter ATP-binding protein [Pseudovibrio axinellae]KZL04582.1 Spermidine/putrescine import ATP-binding protein PotA [Pseudovibrio axinellae]SEQ72332.1 putrescine transport system ATP-binding protein [Pseudovibrio axinellae]
METLVSTQPVSDFAPWNNPGEVPLVHFDGVTKKFGDFTAIENLSLNIYEREFFALLGPSGCGKTTMMRMLAGFEHPTKGNILLGQGNLQEAPPHKRPVNMMFQSYALFPHMNVEQNIGFGLKQDKTPKAEIKRRVEEMLSLVQLEPFAKRKPHQLSGGQKQRVALARSLAKKPKLLLLDEPLGALDRKLREQTQFELMNIQEQLGLTFVIVTHDQEEAMTVASRIAVMDHGKIVQVATPAEIYEYPNSRYSADFLGDVNIIEGRTDISTGETASLYWSDEEAPLTVSTSLRLPAQTTAWLAVRPEKLRISKDKPPTSDNCIQGKVWDIGYTGNISTYHVKVSNGSILKAQVSNQERLADRPITWEDTVFVHWDKGAGVFLET